MSNNIPKPDAERHRVSGNEAYTYEILRNDIMVFKEAHPDIPIFSIGHSVQGRRLIAFKLGSGARRIFFSGAHHGMEWLTAKVLAVFAAEIADGKHGSSDILDGVSLYIVPMVNPDGVAIAASGLKWQANARGVDLNHNYDALWELSRQTERSAGILGPGPTRFGGAFPESEPESRAVADFTRQNRFDTVIALHSQGEVIYYDFCGNIPDGTEDYLRRFEAASRYRREIPDGIASYGGYKDWFIKKYKKPGFTIEIGIGENPLPLSDFDSVYEGVLPLLLEAIK